MTYWNRMSEIERKELLSQQLILKELKTKQDLPTKEGSFLCFTNNNIVIYYFHPQNEDSIKEWMLYVNAYIYVRYPEVKNVYNQLSAISQVYIDHFNKTLHYLKEAENGTLSIEIADIRIKNINKGMIIPYHI